jgi:hypothetical protein
MGKKLKLDLGEFRVESFVTSLEGDQQHKVKGGGDTRFCPSGQYSGCPCDPPPSRHTDCGQFTCFCSIASCITVCLICF